MANCSATDVSLPSAPPTPAPLHRFVVLAPVAPHHVSHRLPAMSSAVPSSAVPSVQGSDRDMSAPLCVGVCRYDELAATLECGVVWSQPSAANRDEHVSHQQATDVGYAPRPSHLVGLLLPAACDVEDVVGEQQEDDVVLPWRLTITCTTCASNDHHPNRNVPRSDGCRMSPSLVAFLDTIEGDVAVLRQCIGIMPDEAHTASAGDDDALRYRALQGAMRRATEVSFEPFAAPSCSVATVLAQLGALWPHIGSSPTAWSGRLHCLSVDACGDNRDDTQAAWATLQALSAGLGLVQRHQLPVHDVVDGGSLQLHPTMMALAVDAEQACYVDQRTLVGLSVFRRDAHPCALYGGGMGAGNGDKDGFSLFTLYRKHALTAGGRDVLRRWLCRLSSCPRTIRARHHAVAWLAQPDSRTTAAKSLRSILGRLQHTSPKYVVFRLRSGCHGWKDYRALLRLALVTREVLEWCNTYRVTNQPHHPLWPFLQPFLRHAADHSRSEAAIADIIRTTLHVSHASSSSTSGSGSGGGQLSTQLTAKILPGVDVELDELRAQRDQLGPFLTRTAEEVAIALPPPFRDWRLTCVYYPGMGYLMAVRTEGGGTNSDSELDLTHPVCVPPQWTVVAATKDGGLLCRTPETEWLDTTIGDVVTAIQLREEAIRTEVDAALVPHLPTILKLSLLAELDAIAAMAAAAVVNDWGPVALYQEGLQEGNGNHFSTRTNNHGVMEGFTLRFRAGRHPLLQQCSADPMVPFDWHWDDGRSQRVPTCPPRVTVITGPNGSGKTVLMQTVGLIAVMAHMGSMVPCSECVLYGTCDRLVYLHDGAGTSLPSASLKHPSSSTLTSAGGSAGGLRDLRQALWWVSRSCGGASTFASELMATSRAISGATSRSLLMLDEFGRGTLATDGIAMLASLLRGVVGLSPLSTMMRSPQPAVILTTHFTELMRPNLGLMQSPLLQHLTMRCVLEQEEEERGCRPANSRQEDTTKDADCSSVHRMPQVPRFTFTFSAVRGGGNFRSTDTVQHCSFAIACAEMCSVPASLIARMHRLHKAILE